MDWNLESVRAVFYAEPSWRQRPLFASIAEREPDEVNKRTSFQFRQEAGAVSGGYLRVTQQGSCIDISFSDMPGRNVTDPDSPGYQQFYWIGPAHSSISIFDEFITKLDLLSMPVSRLAYILTLIYPTASMKEAMVKFKTLLPDVSFDPESDTDLFWQINKPRLIDGVGRINCLSRYHVIQSGFSVHGLMGQAPQMLDLSKIPPTAMRAEIDVNTVIKSPPQSFERPTGILSQLRDTALGVFEKGL
jgi:hypothetical protein